MERKALFIILAVLVLTAVGCGPKEVIVMETVVVKRTVIVREEVVVTATPEPPVALAPTIEPQLLVVLSAFEDPNGDGKQQPGERSVVVGVEIYDLGGEPVDSLRTSTGLVQFYPMWVGDFYQFVAKPPEGYDVASEEFAVVCVLSERRWVVIRRTGEEYGEEQVCSVSFSLTRLPTPTSTPELSETPPPASSTGEAAVLVTVEGDIPALQVGGEFVSAVELEFTLPNGSKTRIAFFGDGWYPVPTGARVGLWIGAGLGGGNWWSRWNCQEAEVTNGEVTLHIVPVPIQEKSPYKGRTPPPQTATPTRVAVPTPEGPEPVAPTHTPPS